MRDEILRLLVELYYPAYSIAYIIETAKKYNVNTTKDELISRFKIVDKQQTINPTMVIDNVYTEERKDPN